MDRALIDEVVREIEAQGQDVKERDLLFAQSVKDLLRLYDESLKLRLPIKQGWPNKPHPEHCGRECSKVAINDGDGWSLVYSCDICCDDSVGEIEWPFESDFVRAQDFRAIGFEIEG